MFIRKIDNKELHWIPSKLTLCMADRLNRKFRKTKANITIFRHYNQFKAIDKNLKIYDLSKEVKIDL